MTTRWFGAPVQRVEDDRLLRGHGRFTDDIGEGALECCFVRSPHAHARITSIDVAAARELPGVVAVYTAADLPFGDVDLPLLIPHPNLTHGRTQRCLASEVVRYAGEAVAFVVADSRYVAEDAADLVQVEYEPLPVVITPEVAAAAEHLVHEDVPGNVAAEMIQETGDVDDALAQAPRRKKLHFRYERGASSPMEARAVWARWNEAERKLTVFDSTQSPTSIRGGLAVLFGLPESHVEVIAPDVGGGCGAKTDFTTEDVLTALFAMLLRRPVRWVTFGGVLVIFAWIVSSLGYGFYISQLADYASVFGNLAVVKIVEKGKQPRPGWIIETRAGTLEERMTWMRSVIAIEGRVPVQKVSM